MTKDDNGTLMDALGRLARATSVTTSVVAVSVGLVLLVAVILSILLL